MSLYFQIIIQNLYKSFDYKGRISRFEYFVFSLFLGLVDVLLLLSHKYLFSLNFNPWSFDFLYYNFFQDVSLLWFLITMPAFISATVRRFHDTNRRARIVWAIFLFSWLLYIVLSNNYELGEYFFVIPLLITLSIVIPIFKKSDESENKFGPKSNHSSNSLIPLFLYVFYTVFSVNWNPQFIYEIDSNEEVVLNPYLHEIKDKSFLDWIGFGNCTHVLLDGTCFIEGDYEILNEAELTNPQDLTKTYKPIQSKLKIRHVRRKMHSFPDANAYCTLDHIEIASAIDENLFFVVKEMMNTISYDSNRCKSPDNKPIALDIYIASHGGQVYYGSLLAIEIKKYGATTHITPNQLCASMCTDLFLAGKERIMHQGSSLGFHSAYNMVDKTCYKELSNRVYYYLSKELSDLVVSDFLNVCNNDEVKSLNPGAARALGLAT